MKKRSLDWKMAWKRTTLPILGLVALTIIVYSNSFSGVFLFDDGQAIVSNPRIRMLWPPSALITVLPPGPVITVTLAVNYALGGLAPWGYHAVNLLIHICSGLVLFGVLRLTFLSFPPRHHQVASGLAFATAAIWMVHPIQTESVTYIIQRYESLMGLCYLLTLYCFIRGAREGDHRGWYGVAVIVCGLGMATKETMVTAPVVVLIYDRIFFSTSFRQLWAHRKGLYAGLATTWILMALIVLKKPYAAWGGFAFAPISPWEYARTQFGVISYYLRLSLFPHPLCLDYGWPLVHRLVDIIPGALLVGCLMGGTVWELVRRTPLGFAGAWFFLTLAPTSSVIPISDLAFEHRMYLPLAAVVAVAVMGVYQILYRLMPAHPARREISGIVLLVVAIILPGVLTLRRNRVYHSPVIMWRDVVIKQPENPRAEYNLGNVLTADGAVEEAVAHYQRAISSRPGYGEAYYNLALNLEKLDRIEEAIQYYREDLKRRPDSAETYNNLARALLEKGNEKEAVGHLRAAIRLDPALVQARVNLANIVARRGGRAEAIARYNEVLRSDPDSGEAHYNLAVTLALEGDSRSAEDHYRAVIRINPEKIEAHYNLALLLSERGEKREAREHLIEALRLEPEFSEARVALDRIEE